MDPLTSELTGYVGPESATPKNIAPMRGESSDIRAIAFKKVVEDGTIKCTLMPLLGLEALQSFDENSIDTCIKSGIDSNCTTFDKGDTIKAIRFLNFFFSENFERRQEYNNWINGGDLDENEKSFAIDNLDALIELGEKKPDEGGIRRETIEEKKARLKKLLQEKIQSTIASRGDERLEQQVQEQKIQEQKIQEQKIQENLDKYNLEQGERQQLSKAVSLQDINETNKPVLKRLSSFGGNKKKSLRRNGVTMRRNRKTSKASR